MSRRKRTSPAEDVLDLVALLPWWAGVALALLSYLLLHGVATQPLPAAPTEVGQMGTFVTKSMWRTLATFGQYLLPALCLAGAAVSAWRRSVRTKLVADVAQSKSSNALDGMTWQQFEMLVAEGFRMQGYRVAEAGGGGPDGGVDLVLSKPGDQGGEKVLVQCKQWRAFKVGVSVVRELYGVMAAKGATGGFVVTSGRFTAEAVEFAEGRNITLMDGPKLHDMIRRVQSRPARVPTRTPVAIAPAPARAAATATAPEKAITPTCPLCAKAMVKRTAQRGANAGKQFWGCSGFPSCKGTRTTD